MVFCTYISIETSLLLTNNLLDFEQSVKYNTLELIGGLEDYAGLFFTRIFPNIGTLRSPRCRYSLIEKSTSILTEEKEASQPKLFLTCNNLNIYYLMVVLRFLFRSFTPTFSLYKAVFKKEKQPNNKSWQLHSTGTGKQTIVTFFEGRRKHKRKCY